MKRRVFLLFSLLNFESNQTENEQHNNPHGRDAIASDDRWISYRPAFGENVADTSRWKCEW